MTWRPLPLPAEIVDRCPWCDTPVEPSVQRQWGQLPVVKALYRCIPCRGHWVSTWVDIDEGVST